MGKKIAPDLNAWVSFWIQKDGEGIEMKKARAQLRAILSVVRAAKKARPNCGPNCTNPMCKALARLDKVSGDVK
jgi:hypothetical protein